MKTPEEYLKSLAALDREIYFMGQIIENPTTFPYFTPSLNAVKKTYELASSPEHEDIVTAESHLTGEKINRFTHIICSKEDLNIKIKMLRLFGQKTGTCFQRCAGMDALNSVYSVTYDIDQEKNTNYFDRFKNFLIHVQQNDLVCCAAMTDPKGDRSKPPGKQIDPDMYLRVVAKNNKGITVRGAKAHQTGALNSHEIVVLPTTALKSEDAEYAIMFAIPADTENIIYIGGRQPTDLRTLSNIKGASLDLGNPSYGGQEMLVVFDNVFIPWDRVFMCGEYDFASLIVERFASYHRQSYGGCKVGVGDTVIGASASIAVLNGINNKSHIKDKLVKMTFLNETMYACAIAAAAEGLSLPCGSCWVNPLLANITKLHVTEAPYEISRLAQDIAGGLMVTLPSGPDLVEDRPGKFIKKYLKKEDDQSVYEKYKVLRYLENVCFGRGGVSYLTESLHGAGSPQAQKIMIERYYNLESKIEALKKIIDQ